MINRIHIKNFKCLLDVDVPLGAFNILIGPNDSGKSSFLEAIRLLGQTARQPFVQVFTDPLSLENLVWRREQNREVVWKVEGTTPRHPFTYRLALAPGDQYPRVEELLVGEERYLLVDRQPDGIGRSAFPYLGQNQAIQLPLGSTALGMVRSPSPPSYHIQPNRPIVEQMQELDSIIDSLGATVEYRLDPVSIRKAAVEQTHPPSGTSTATNGAVLNTTGNNLIGVLDSIMTSPRRTNIINLEKDLHAAISTLSGISLPRRQQNEKSLAFTLTGNESEPVTIPAALASDGALLVTAFLALAYGSAPEIIFIEEPENGLHCSLLKLAIEILRKISTGKVGNRPRQVILTTHSPLLLNFAKPEEVRVFSRRENGATQVAPMEKVPNLKTLLEEFGLGELWFQLGEDRLVEEAKG
jgi:predicted ATPase